MPTGENTLAPPLPRPAKETVVMAISDRHHDIELRPELIDGDRDGGIRPPIVYLGS